MVQRDVNLDNGDIDMTTSVKRYFRTGREGTHLLAAMREFLGRELGLYRECTIFQKSGGRSGDLCEEIMEYEEWMHGSANGYTRGGVILYSVIDHSVNGYAHQFSVIIGLPEGKKISDRLLAFLDEHDFVAKYRSFAERPVGFHRYRGYLDEWPSLPNLHGVFHHESAVVKKTV